MIKDKPGVGLSVPVELISFDEAIKFYELQDEYAYRWAIDSFAKRGIILDEKTNRLEMRQANV